MRSALLAVDGVRRARVSLETRDALVTYDPAVARVDALIDAVRKAEGFSPYDAAVKVAPRTGEP